MKRVFSLFYRAKKFYEKNERVLAISAMILGFTVDNMTLRRVDLLFENLALIAYLLIAGIAILVINIHDSGLSSGRIIKWLRLLSPITLQFAFGGLFSAFFVFYFRSASVGSSWPFILFLLAMMIGNELFSKRFEQLTFQIGVFYIALLSYSILAIPIIAAEISLRTFFLSIIFSLFLVYLFLFVLSKINKGIFLISRRYIFSEIFAVSVLILALYLFNIIPPIPLSVKEKAVAYEVERLTSGDYKINRINSNLQDDFLGRTKVNLTPGQPLYVFSSVFAPTRLRTNIVHEWQFQTSDGWQTVSRIPFEVTGGAERGYRGYTYKSNLYPGKWRVNIETERGATIGRIKFILVNSDYLSNYQSIIY